MQVRSLATIKSILEPDEQIRWHAIVAPRTPGQIPVMMIPISLVIVAIATDWGLKILFGVAAFFLIKWLFDMDADADTMIFTDRRVLHVTGRCKLKAQYPLENAEVKGSAATKYAELVVKDGQYTIRWLLKTHGKHDTKCIAPNTAQ